LPLTHFVRLIRGVILKGASLGQMMGDVYALFLFAFVMLMVAIARFKKRLE
jgi:ABC-2 type transport system permease protein